MGDRLAAPAGSGTMLKLVTCLSLSFLLITPLTWAQKPVSVQYQQLLMEARGAFKPKSVSHVGANGRRYTMTYTGPDRHFKSIRFGLYPEVGKARMYSVLSGWFYKGREYPVSFECHKLASMRNAKFRLLLDQVEH